MRDNNCASAVSCVLSRHVNYLRQYTWLLWGIIRPNIRQYTGKAMVYGWY